VFSTPSRRSARYKGKFAFLLYLTLNFSVKKVLGYWLDNWCSIPGGVDYVTIGSHVYSSFYPMNNYRSFPGGKAAKT
jgi:hypothetical protein